MKISRKRFVKSFAAAIAFVQNPGSFFKTDPPAAKVAAAFKRLRPGDAGWPAAGVWEKLKADVGGNLLQLGPVFHGDNDLLFKQILNPYFNNGNPSLTQTLGWVDAWKSQPSAYAVSARSSQDVAAAVNFAREHKLRLVVKGGGHSYQGNSSSADSLLVWTRNMRDIKVLDNFTPAGCEKIMKPQPAVVVESGALWGHVYDAVTTKHGRYVQGGGCMTVGVAGLIQGGGFGSFSKYYGLAAAGLLEAEVILADGSLQIVNAGNHPDLFWALKGGGGGSFCVVTKLTLKTRELPALFGAAFGRVKASDDAGYQKLVGRIMRQYRDKLFNPAWGEQITFHSDLSISVSMLVHGLTKDDALAAWQDFQNWIKENDKEFTWVQPLNIISLPARNMWDPGFLRKYASDLISVDDQPGAAEENIYWKGDGSQSGQFIQGYYSGWLSQDLLKDENLTQLVKAVVDTSKLWSFALHFNKGLAGTRPEELVEAGKTSINPAVLDAFALLILAGEGAPAMPGVKGHEPDFPEARAASSSMRTAMQTFQSKVNVKGSYVYESDYFEKNWQESFWGSNYQKLSVVKKAYDPEGLFFVHHGVGSENWSADGFTKLS